MQTAPQEQIIYWPNESEPSHRIVVRPNRIEIEQADGCAADGLIRWLPLAAAFDDVPGLVHFDIVPPMLLVGMLAGVARQLVAARCEARDAGAREGVGPVEFLGILKRAAGGQASDVFQADAAAPGLSGRKEPGSAWTAADDRELQRLVKAGVAPRERAQALGRSVDACGSRLRRLREAGR